MGESQQCPRAHQHHPEISHLLPLSLRKPGPSPPGEAQGAGAACCPHINALKLPAEDLCVSNSFPGPPGFGLGSASTFPSCPLWSVLTHTPNLVIFPGFSMQNAHPGPAFAGFQCEFPISLPHQSQLQNRNQMKPYPQPFPEPKSPDQKGIHMRHWECSSCLQP